MHWLFKSIKKVQLLLRFFASAAWCGVCCSVVDQICGVQFCWCSLFFWCSLRWNYHSCTTLELLYKIKYWWQIYFGKLVVLWAATNLKFANILLKKKCDVMNYIHQVLWCCTSAISGFLRTSTLRVFTSWQVVTWCKSFLICAEPLGWYFIKSLIMAYLDSEDCDNVILRLIQTLHICHSPNSLFFI